MLKKWITASLAMTMMISFMTGCGDRAEENNSDAAIIVQVTKVDGNSITADVGEISAYQMGMKDGTPPENAPSGAPGQQKTGDGAPPENATGGNQSVDGAIPSGSPENNKPDKENPPEKLKDGSSDNSDGDTTSHDRKENDNSDEKNGESPAGKPGGNGFTANGESITFSITDSTKITQEFPQESEDVSVEDIVENSVLEVTIDSKNQANKVIIKNLRAGGRFDGTDKVTNGTSANTTAE